MTNVSKNQPHKISININWFFSSVASSGLGKIYKQQVLVHVLRINDGHHINQDKNVKTFKMSKLNNTRSANDNLN